MKRKLLAVVITAAMVAGALPGAVSAATAAETLEASAAQEESGVQEESGIQEEPEIQEDTGAKLPAAQTEARADVIDTQDELEAAITQGGEIDLSGQRIELTRPLSIANDVVIRGGTLVGTDSVTGNLVTLMGNQVTLQDVTIQTSGANKSALHAYGTALTVNGLAIDHSSSAGGAPIIISNGANAGFAGNINLTLGTGSWYGINVDSARADFSAAVLNAAPLTDTQSVICQEGSGASVSGAGLTVVVTEKDGGAGRQQTAYVADANLAQFVSAKTAGGKDISKIELHKDVTLTAPLILSEAMAVSGASDGFEIIGSGAVGNENVVTVTADGVKLSRIGIRTSAANKSALHVFKANAELENVTLDNTETSGGSGMVVDGGNVKISGPLDIRLGENSVGGIKLETANGSAGVAFENGSSVNLTGNGQSVIHVDEADKNAVTVTGAEDAGLVQDADGNYIPAGSQEKPGQPGGSGEGSDPSDGEDPSGGQNPSGSGEKDPESGAEPADEETGENEKAPQTGDDTGAPYAALAALLGSGAAAGAVLKARKRGRLAE